MKRDDFGVWEIVVPPLPSGACAIPHDSKLKVLRFNMFRGCLMICLQHPPLDFHGSSQRLAY